MQAMLVTLALAKGTETMDMSGEYRIPAPRQTVWEALNDPEILKAAIPGCEELTAEGDNGFAAKVRAKVGPVSARFQGKVALLDLDPPNGYRIEGEGTGGAAGFAKGGATVKLTEDGGETILNYEANASVGGKLAQIGSRLIDGAAKKMADDFFAKFSAIVGEQAAAAAEPEPSAAAAPAPEAAIAATTAAPPRTAPAQVPAKKGISPWIWIGGAGIVLVVLIALLQ
jgi:carbon monoxide dehydrogenase subunit G